MAFSKIEEIFWAGAWEDLSIPNSLCDFGCFIFLCFELTCLIWKRKKNDSYVFYIYIKKKNILRIFADDLFFANSLCDSGCFIFLCFKLTFLIWKKKPYVEPLPTIYSSLKDFTQYFIIFYYNITITFIFYFYYNITPTIEC